MESRGRPPLAEERRFDAPDPLAELELDGAPAPGDSLAARGADRAGAAASARTAEPVAESISLAPALSRPAVAGLRKALSLSTSVRAAAIAASVLNPASVSAR